MRKHRPPLTLTSRTLIPAAEIGERAGHLPALHEGALTPQLRWGSRIRTIQVSLVIESDTLSVEQVAAVLDGKCVLSLLREIQEVRNAFSAYEAVPG